ncbi:MAG: ABC transporter substrate-binding protein [Proteobacteria bacterium]|nr:ABC transporter substrate-binding protein [Pseudomonadota bacterium]
MRRRVLLAMFGGAAAPWLLRTAGALAQSPAKPFRVGVLLGAASPDAVPFADFRDELRRLGYEEGRTIEFEMAATAVDYAALPQAAATLVEKHVDVIVTFGLTAVRAAATTTRNVPIVALGSPDLIGAGFAQSYARPGGNVTGQLAFTAELTQKRIELLKELRPGLMRVGVLFNSDSAGEVAAVKRSHDWAQQLNMSVHETDIRRHGDLVPAFAAMANASVGALATMPSTFLLNFRQDIASLALARGLPSVFTSREYAVAGGLMSYGPNFPLLFRHAAQYVDLILRGTKPADLPIEEARDLSLVLNVRTAKALGLTIPQSILVRADEVIE